MAEKDAKEAVEEVRKGIDVVVSKKDDDGNVIETKPEGEEKPEGEVKEEKEEVETEEEEVEEKDPEVKEEEIETKEEDDPVKLKRTIERLQKRVGKTVGERKEIERKLQAAEAALLAKPDGEKVLTQKDVEDLAEKKANDKQLQRDFVNACNKIFDDAIKVDKTFKTKVDAMTDDIGPIPPVMVGVLEDLDNPGAVLNHLTEDADLTEKLYVMSPAKMAVELTKISTKLAAKPKKPVKDVSKTPDPVNPLGGKTNASADINLTRKDLSDKDWIEQRNRDIANKRSAGRMNLR